MTTILISGLTASGKTTFAKKLQTSLKKQGCVVSNLDGDTFRNLVSKGLTFSREDRIINNKRMGFVAAEVARHGGVTIIAAIAPYREGREAIASMTASVGGDFILVHTATDLDTCRKYDTTGLYKRVFGGERLDVSGVSSPYEQPEPSELNYSTTVSFFRTFTQDPKQDDVVKRIVDLCLEKKKQRSVEGLIEFD